MSSTAPHPDDTGGYRARIGRFLKLYAWLVRDALGGQKMRVTLITVASFLGAFAQGATIWLLSILLRVLESDGTWVSPLIHVELHRSFITLVIVVAVLVGLQIISAFAIYAAAVHARALARIYHRKSAMRTLRAFSTCGHISRDDLPEIGSPIRLSVVRNPRVMGKATEILLSSIQYVCSAVAYVVVMFALSARISVLILPAFLILLPFLYRVGTRTQETSRAFYDHSIKEMSGVAKRLIGVANATNLHRTLYEADVPARYRDDESVQRYYESYDHLLLAAARSVLVTALFRPILLGVILLVLGWFALRESYSWGVILPFIIALLQLFNQVQYMATSLAALHRFYPRIGQYTEVARALEAPGDASRTPAQSIDLDGVTIEPGDVVVCGTDTPLTRVDLDELTAALNAVCGSPVWTQATFVGRGYVPPPAPLEALIGNAPGDLVAGLDLPDAVDDAAWLEMTPEQRSAVALLALAAAPGPVAFVDVALVEALTPAHLTSILAHFSDRIVFVITADRRTEVDRASVYMLVERGTVSGAGDRAWWCGLPRRRERIVRPRAVAAGDLGEEDDDDDL